MYTKILKVTMKLSICEPNECDSLIVATYALCFKVKIKICIDEKAYGI